MENAKVKLVVGLVIGFVAFIVLLIINPFVTVSAGERGVVLNWGAVSGEVLNEGIHWVTPIKQSVQKLDVRVQKEQAGVGAASKDLQTVTAEVALNYHLQEDKVNLIWQKIGKDYKERVIDPAIQEAVKAVTAKFTAEELITKREQVKEETKLALRARLAEDFITVDELSIVNFEFSNSFNDAIEAKVTAEQNALASKNQLEQVKYEAEQRIVQARGEAEAIKIQAQAIQNQGGAEYVRLKAIEKWNGNLPTYTLGNSVPFINITQ